MIDNVLIISIQMLVWVVFILIAGVYNAHLISEGKRPNYLVHNIVKGFVAFFVLLWMRVTPENTLIPFVWLLTSYYAIFNPFLNYQRGLPFFYVGLNSGWIDSFLYKHKWLIKPIYLLAAGLFLVTSVLMFYNF